MKLTGVDVIVVSLLLCIVVQAGDIVVLKPLDNVIALQSTSVTFTMSVEHKEHLHCDISVNNIKIFDNGTLYDEHLDDIGKERVSCYQDVVPFCRSDETELTCGIEIQSMRPCHAGLYSFSFQDGSESYGAYIAYLESGPTCSSNRDTADKHQNGDRTILTCTLLASVNIQHGLELLWNYRNGTSLDKSLKIGCSGHCNSVAGGKNHILTSQVKLFATDYGTTSVTCSVLFNATLLGASDKSIADNVVVHSTNCSSKSYPIVNAEKDVSRHVVNNVENDSILSVYKILEQILAVDSSILHVVGTILIIVSASCLILLYQTKKCKAVIKKIKSWLCGTRGGETVIQETEPLQPGTQETAQNVGEGIEASEVEEINKTYNLQEEEMSGESVNLRGLKLAEWKK